MFRRAYGHDTMLSETRDALLYAQLQEGLKYDLMKALAVSGALNYQALCVAAKSEERRLAELQKRKYYQLPQLRGTKKEINQPQVSTPGSQLKPGQSHNRSTGASQFKQGQSAASSTDSRSRKCWNCEETGHMAYNCPKPKRALADQTTNQSVPRW